MPTTTPKFCIGDEVYLVESAKLGFLESYQLTGVRRDPSDSTWMYSISVPGRPPLMNTTVGDRIRLTNPHDFELAEEELGTLCETLDLAIESKQRDLTALQSKKDALCPDETG